MQKILLTYTTCDTKELLVNEAEWDNFCLKLKHIDLSTEFISRQQIKSVRVWTQLNIDNKVEDELTV